MNSPQPIRFVKTLPVEEGARADLYALLAHLFYAGPDEALLQRIVAADGLIADTGSPLAKAWAQLRKAAGATQARDAKQEYEDLFIGVGRAPISIYASHYLSENWKEHTLVNLRDELDRLGLARQGGAVEPEDHLAGLLDVMRHLVIRHEDGDVALQESFFRSYLSSWYARFVSNIGAEPRAAFYLSAGRLLQTFLDVEVECFQIA